MNKVITAEECEQHCLSTKLWHTNFLWPSSSWVKPFYTPLLCCKVVLKASWFICHSDSSQRQTMPINNINEILVCHHPVFFPFHHQLMWNKAHTHTHNFIFPRSSTGGVHSYRNCCFLKVVHTTVASKVDTHYYDFSVLHTLTLNKTTRIISKYIWLGG